MDSRKVTRDVTLTDIRASDDGTFSASLSSEAPVERFFGDEILDHTERAIDLSRAADGLPLLDGHNPGQQIGIVERIRLTGRRLRGRLRFAQHQRAQDVLAMVRDGIARSMSVGYVVREMKAEGDGVFRVTRWEPLEASIVAIPADPAVGIGRARDVLTLRETPNMQTTDHNETVAAERERIASIDKVAEKYPVVRELAAKARAAGTAAADFNAMALDRITAMQTDYTPPDNPHELGLSAREARGFSFVRALRAQIDPRYAQREAGFELEVSAAWAKTVGQQARGVFVPPEVLRQPIGSLGRRDLTAGTATDGAELVSTDLLAESFIDVLRNASLVMTAGATVLDGLSGDVAIPRKTAAASFGWISSEGGNVSQSDPQFDQVTLTPKTVGTYTEYTRQLLLQSSLDIESLVRSDFANGMAIELDHKALYGSGASGQPTGVANTTGINDPTDFAAAVPTFAEVIALETAVEVDNALQSSRMAYFTDPTTKGALKSTDVGTDTGTFVWAEGAAGVGRLNGYNAWASNQVTAGDVFFGYWPDLLIGMWRGLDILVDPYTNSLSGTVRVVCHQSIDVAVRHAVSFAHNNDGV